MFIFFYEKVCSIDTKLYFQLVSTYEIESLIENQKLTEQLRTIQICTSFGIYFAQFFLLLILFILFYFSYSIFRVYFYVLPTSIAAMISYNVVVGDTLSKVLIRFVPSWNTSMSEVRFCVVFVVTVCIVIPLCLYKNVSRLARVSFISLVCVVFILFAIIVKLISGDYDFV